jgi:GT2 family glycosyltransferase
VNREQHQTSVRDVTACIPTLGQVEDVRRTIESLLSARRYPATILISDGAHDDRARVALRRALQACSAARAVDGRLLPQPPCGSATGNRNWLALHVETPLLLFLDDDVDVHPDFVDDAISSIEHRNADVVVAASTTMGGSGWFTARGHFRPIKPGDPIAVGLACSLWQTDLFRALWLDERIDYGYEDADLSLRLHGSRSPTVEQSPHDFVHRSVGEQFDPAKDVCAERARAYVSAKRHARTRRALFRFLILEMSCNAIRGRRLLPHSQVHDQWQSLGKYLAGAKPPSWANAESLTLTGKSREGET